MHITAQGTTSQSEFLRYASKGRVLIYLSKIHLIWPNRPQWTQYKSSISVMISLLQFKFLYNYIHLTETGKETPPRYSTNCDILMIPTCINMPCCRLCFRLASRCFWSTDCSREILCSSRASPSASSFPDLRSCRCLLFRDCNTPHLLLTLCTANNVS